MSAKSKHQRQYVPSGLEMDDLRGRPLETLCSTADERLNVLFICSKNQWRSPTAEQVWRRHPALAVRSAGTSPNARHHVSEQDLRWAKVIFVMEEKHKARLLADYRRMLEHTTIHVLDIPDEYKYMDPELVAELERSVAEILGL